MIEAKISFCFSSTKSFCNSIISFCFLVLRGNGDGTGGVVGVFRDRDLSATDHLIGEQSGHVGPQGIGGAAEQQEA